MKKTNLKKSTVGTWTEETTTTTTDDKNYASTFIVMCIALIAMTVFSLWLCVSSICFNINAVNCDGEIIDMCISESSDVEGDSSDIYEFVVRYLVNEVEYQHTIEVSWSDYDEHSVGDIISIWYDAKYPDNVSRCRFQTVVPWVLFLIGALITDIDFIRKTIATVKIYRTATKYKGTW